MSMVGYHRIIPGHGNNHWGGIGWVLPMEELPVI
jgi:hypothetical protein